MPSLTDIFSTIQEEARNTGLTDDACPFSPEDFLYLSQLSSAQEITLMPSNIDWLHPNGAFCLRVPSDSQNEPIQVDKCVPTRFKYIQSCPINKYIKGN